MDHFYTYIYQHANNLYLRGYSKGKPFCEEITDYKPYLFVPGPGKYRTIDGRQVQKKHLDSIFGAHGFLKWHKEEVYGLTDFQYVFLNDEFPGQVDYDFNLLSIISIDIEVDSRKGMPSPIKAEDEITAITLIKKNQILTLGTKPYNGKYKQFYFHCKDEVELLLMFLKFLWYKDWSPDVLTGWNIDRFDIPYIINRIRNLLGESYVKQLSPWGFVREKDIARGKSTANGDERTDTIWEIAGVTQLDYMQLYKRFNPVTQESYSLNNIASVELGEKKVDYKALGYKDLNDLYDRNFELYIDYNIKDALLVQRIDERCGFILLVISIAYKAKINYLDAFTTVKPWDIIIHNYLMDRNIVVPMKEEHEKRDLIGAYCKEPHVGMHHWIVSFDFEGEYPSVISQCNISPETFVEKIDVPSIQHLLTRDFSDLTEYARSKNCCLTANGCLYRKDIRGFIPELVDQYKADRAVVKGKLKDLKKLENKTEAINNEIIKQDNFQLAIKILTNGLYGALSNVHFRWFNIDPAESVTMTSQLATRYMEICVNRYLNNLLKTKDKDYVIAADTDSNYIVLESLVLEVLPQGAEAAEIIEFLDKVCKQAFKPLLERANITLSTWLNSYKQVLKMNQDIIASKAIWTAKKRYIAKVHDKEGLRYKQPDLYYKGIEVVRSSTPMVCRKTLRECLDIIMNGTEEDLRQHIGKFEPFFKSLPAIDIAKPSSVKKLAIYAMRDKGIPMHVRGSLNYNMLLKEYKLDNKLPQIRDHDKIKTLYLKLPNPLKDYVISFHEEIPEEWELNQYVDYDKQWEKAFVNPLQSITDVINWNLIKVDDLSNFFI